MLFLSLLRTGANTARDGPSIAKYGRSHETPVEPLWSTFVAAFSSSIGWIHIQFGNMPSGLAPWITTTAGYYVTRRKCIILRSGKRTESRFLNAKHEERDQDDSFEGKSQIASMPMMKGTAGIGVLLRGVDVCVCVCDN